MFNPAQASENIKNEFVDYVATTHFFADKRLQSQFVDELGKTVSRGPLLEVKDIFKSGLSINQLIDKGVLVPSFRDLEAGKPKTNLYKPRLPLDRPLYLHQQKAIETIVDGNNAVISTGTGSGKTNCFLIPVLNDLLKERESGALGDGVRALFIYPMNALANDQMKNIRSILMMFPDITFGVYNGATEEDEDAAIAVYEAMFANESVPELRHRLPNELLSREEMKETPPNILFTNYAMLEHLLFRPKDDVLFSRSDFKFVVLDEAHIYTGATGIETSILLRRLRARIRSTRDTQFILTSATLGSDESSDEDILTFAENLCGVPFKKGSIIRGTREQYIPNGNLQSFPEELYQQLGDEEHFVWEVLSTYGITVDKNLPEDQILYDFILQTDLYAKMRQAAFAANGIIEIAQLSQQLDVSINTAISFVSICTRAQKNGRALIDARYHFFVRSLEGCYLSYGKEPKLFLNRRKTFFQGDEQYAVFEVAICDDCGRIAFVGREKDRSLSQTSKLEDEVEYYYPIEDKNDDIESEEYEDDVTASDTYYLCTRCGAITPVDEAHNEPCECGKSHYIKVVKAKMLSNGARCGNCKTGVYKRVYLGNDAATSVLATALYEELPEVEFYEEENIVKTSNIFARAAQSNRKLAKKTGRQFLSFSDSRQEAAKFACYLGDSYNEFLRRRGICQVIASEGDSMKKHTYTISDFVSLLTNYFTSKKSFAKSNSDESNLTVNSRRNAWVAAVNELSRYSSSTSLTALGIVQFEYLGNTSEIVQSIAEIYHVSPMAAKNLMDLLAFEVVKCGAVSTDTATDINDNDRQYIFYTPSQRFITFMQSPDKKRSTVSNWAPRNKGSNAEEYYKTNRMYYVCNTLGVPEKDAFAFLKDYFDYLTKPEYGNSYCMEDPNRDGTYVMPAHHFRVRVAGDPDAHWYRCKRCGRVSQFNLNGHCSSVRCGGDVEEIDPLTLRENNHFAKLYLSDRMSPLFIKEHTAQLSKKEAAEYQEEFIKKDINALSCSTTFEMGVDVGDLETVFLRDVPPLPSNYAQRAGRAGRSVNAAAYALTFAKLSSHDLSFFKDPKQMIGGVILPPLFKVDNEKIVRRHIYAVALSMFFASNEYMYNHNDAEEFINKKGYQEFISWLNSHPERLKDMLKRSIPDINDLHQRVGINDFSWVDDFSGPDGVFTQLISEYERTVIEFDKQIRQAQKEGNLEGAASIKRKQDIFKRNKLIDFLARGNILPRYGFPVDTVELQQNSTASNIQKLRLSRDLQVAIAEYAPSSEVIADGRLYTSRYIRKSIVRNNRQDWHTAYIGVCDDPTCKTVNYSLTPIGRDGFECISCGKKLTSMNFFESIEPRSGFVAERQDKDVPMTRQEKNYKSEDHYIGNTASKTIDKFNFEFNGVGVHVESTTNDSLLVKSSKDFYVCPLCGFGYAQDEGVGDRSTNKQMEAGFPHVTIAKDHESLFGQYKCLNHDFVKRSLHHVFNTDVAKISFDCDTSNYETMVSVMYAILGAIAKDLNIEKRDIKACLSMKVINHQICQSIIIYDAVPGGAGHSRRLVTKDGMMLYKIFMSALNRMETCNCDPSCYNCLRSYENQKIHDILSRKLAADFLKQFVGAVTVVEE